MAPLLREAGVTFNSTPFSYMGKRTEPQHPLMGIDAGVVHVDRGDHGVRWDAIAATPPEHIRGPILGLHWPNILHQDPGQNGEVVDRWVAALEWFDRRLDGMLARDTAALQNQLAFHLGTSATVRNDEIACDFTALAPLAEAVTEYVFTLKFAPESEVLLESPDMRIVDLRRCGEHWVARLAIDPKQRLGRLVMRAAQT